MQPITSARAINPTATEPLPTGAETPLDPFGGSPENWSREPVESTELTDAQLAELLASQPELDPND